MPLSRKTQVQNGIDKLGERAANKVGADYERETLGPVAKRLHAAGSAAEALALMNGSLLGEMETTSLEDALTDAAVQGIGIGATEERRQRERAARAAQGRRDAGT